jgi:hypothetical protein
MRPRTQPGEALQPLGAWWMRLAGALTVVAVLGFYYGVHEDLPSLPRWGDVAFLGLGLMPLTFALVWLALPGRDRGARDLAIAALSLIGIAALLEWADLDVAANFVKIAAVACVGWWFLGFFEALSWVLLVAVLIVPVDSFSVARGPTKEIVENQPQVFDALSIAFPLPGEHSSAQLGLPDILFFSLFLAAAARFGLRVGWTWLAMALSFGATLALAVGFDVAGLPALPLLSIAFILVNADLIWRAYRERSATPSK